MFARVSTLQGSPDSVDAGLDDVKSNVLPAIRQVPGFAGMIALTDRSSGKTIGITLWESEAALKDSEDSANRLRSGVADAGASHVVSVESFEVALDER